MLLEYHTCFVTSMFFADNTKQNGCIKACSDTTVFIRKQRLRDYFMLFS